MTVDPIRAGRRSKRRGKRGEAQVVDILKTHGWPRARRNLEQPQYGRDVVDGPEGTRLSVKYTERLKLREAFAECSLHAGMVDIPIVVHRCNEQPWLATIEFTELLALLALRERG